MDVFGDFCLACDNQTNGGDYCSQACRLAGLDRYGTSEPASPTFSNMKYTIRHSSGSSRSGIYLPPAIDFSVYRVPSSNSITTVKSSRSSSKTRLSGEVQTILQDYAGAFDQTRTMRRRVSVQSTDGDDKFTTHR